MGIDIGFFPNFLSDITNLFFCSVPPNGRALNDRIRKALEFIDRHYHEIKRQSQIAEVAGLTYDRFRKEFPREAGRSSNEAVLENGAIEENHDAKPGKKAKREAKE